MAKGNSSKNAKKFPFDSFTPKIQDYLTDEISRMVGETVAATCKRCIDSELAFVDEQTVKRPSFVSTCEVLETILIPMLVLGDKYLPQGVNERESLNRVIFKSLIDLIDQAEVTIENGKVLLPGDPYFYSTGDRYYKATSEGWPYIEANAFFVSVVLHFLLTKKYFRSIPKELKDDRLKRIAGKAIEQVLNQFILTRGWSHSTNKFDRGIYFTWSVVETLAEVLESKEHGQVDLLGKKLNTLKGELAQVLESLELHLFSTGSTGHQFVFSPEAAKGNAQLLYNNLQAFIVLGILDTSRYIEMTQALISLVANSHLFATQPIFGANYSMEHELVGTAKLEDRSILPLIIRSIATVFGEYFTEEFSVITKKARLRSPWSYQVMADRLKELRSKQTKDKLWGPDGVEYEIYYTERVIEALISCYSYINDPGKRSPEFNLKYDAKKFNSFSQGFKNVGTQMTGNEG